MAKVERADRFAEDRAKPCRSLALKIGAERLKKIQSIKPKT